MAIRGAQRDPPDPPATLAEIGAALEETVSLPRTFTFRVNELAASSG